LPDDIVTLGKSVSDDGDRLPRRFHPSPKVFSVISNPVTLTPRRRELTGTVQLDFRVVREIK
jgi:hypothetical protein